jgi:hypothetical protein
MGVRHTHLDSHQYRPIMSGKELFEAMPRVAHDYKLPMFVTRDWFADYPICRRALNDIVLDHTARLDPKLHRENGPSFKSQL